MGAGELIAALATPPDKEKSANRDVVRVARVRMRWVGDEWVIGYWEFDEPQGVSTYYEERVAK